MSFRYRGTITSLDTFHNTSTGAQPPVSVKKPGHVLIYSSQHGLQSPFIFCLMSNYTWKGIDIHRSESTERHIQPSLYLGQQVRYDGHVAWQIKNRICVDKNYDWVYV